MGAKEWAKTHKLFLGAAGAIGAAYLGGHVIHHYDKLDAIGRMNAELPRGSDILNVGAKNYSMFENRLGRFRTTNIDVVPRDIPNFYLMDVRSLEFPDNSFQGILCSHVLEHLPKEDVEAAVSEINRVCRDDGKVYIVLPRWWVLTTWLDFDHKWIPTENGLAAIISYSPRDFKAS